jgi:hypothetical protein
MLHDYDKRSEHDKQMELLRQFYTIAQYIETPKGCVKSKALTEIPKSFIDKAKADGKIGHFFSALRGSQTPRDPFTGERAQFQLARGLSKGATKAERGVRRRADEFLQRAKDNLAKLALPVVPTAAVAAPRKRKRDEIRELKAQLVKQQQQKGAREVKKKKRKQT